MNEHTTIGLDIAKHVFHAVICNEYGKVTARKKLKRAQVMSWFAQQPACRVGLEACSGSHYWGRQLQSLGHEVSLLPAQHVKAFLRGNKTDYKDALAIAEALRHAELRAVAVKTVSQQDIQAIHRMRSMCIGQRTALANQLRGLLSEYGIVIRKGMCALRGALPQVLEDAENGLSDRFRTLLSRGIEQLRDFDASIARYDDDIKVHGQTDEACGRLRTIPGYGPVLASAFRAQVYDGRAYRCGRDVSASVGIVPAQHSSAGRAVLLGISKRGDPYLRTLLVQGARSVVSHAKRKSDPLSLWVCRIVAQRGFNKAVVALANKIARIGWAVLRHGGDYRPGAIRCASAS